MQWTLQNFSLTAHVIFLSLNIIQDFLLIILQILLEEFSYAVNI
jgi:hypothetical protein